MRLNSNARDRIISQAMAGTFEKQKHALEVRETALCEKLYNTIVPPKLRKQIADLPPGWISLSGKVRFNVGGQTVDLCHKAGLPTKHGYHCYTGPVGVVTDVALIDLVRKLQGDMEDYKSSRARAEATLKALLAGIASTETLRKAWPEGKKFYADIETSVPTPPGLPAVRVQELNAMLGLKQAA